MEELVLERRVLRVRGSGIHTLMSVTGAWTWRTLIQPGASVTRYARRPFTSAPVAGTDDSAGRYVTAVPSSRMSALPCQVTTQWPRKIARRSGKFEGLDP
jgi:hypothetical protein